MVKCFIFKIKFILARQGAQKFEQVTQANPKPISLDRET